MPVSVVITITDPPAVPTNYMLCAFEVRMVQARGGARPDSRESPPLAIFPGTTAGFEIAAVTLIKAVKLTLRDFGQGLRLAAVAWWVEKPMSECEDGRERLVSIFDAAEEAWGEWQPEQKIGTVATVNSGAKWTSSSVRRGPSNKSLGGFIDND